MSTAQLFDENQNIFEMMQSGKESCCSCCWYDSGSMDADDYVDQEMCIKDGVEDFDLNVLCFQLLCAPLNSGQKSLMSNAFTINSAEQSPTTRRNEQCTLGAQRRLNIAPLRMNYDEVEAECGTPEKSSEEMSFYCGNSPQQSPEPCPSPCMESDLSPETSPTRLAAATAVDMVRPRRLVIDEQDTSSMDSGYAASYSEKVSTVNGQSVFKFREPSGLAPRKTPAKSSPTSSMRAFHHSLSSGSMESNDDEFMELLEMESLDDDTQLPEDLNSLLSGDIKAVRNTPEQKAKPIARRSLSLTENRLMNRARSNLFEMSTPERKTGGVLSQLQNQPYPTTPCSGKSGTFKRPEPPSISPVQSKRYKYESDHQENIAPVSQVVAKPARPQFKKSVSMNDAVIMNALARSNSEPNLIGDFSRPFVLPLTEGRHNDLKAISVDTMARLLKGEFTDSVASFKVIDCRYPYEFQGGHIRGALNLYMQDQILDEFVNVQTKMATTDLSSHKRNILVFHCEFSSERGPKLSRFLRNNDRQRNTDSYPALHYPEIYLLHGGYKDFFAVHPELCDPVSYRPMLDPAYSEEFKLFRAKTRSWTGDPKASAVKGTLKKSRSRLVL